MSDLAELQAASVPRPDALAQRYARRIEPMLGFVVYGVLWLFIAVAVGTVLMLGAIALGLAVGVTKGSSTMEGIGFTTLIIGFAFAYWAYVAWARRKRGRARRLVRDGTFVDGTVVDRIGDRAVQAAAKLAFAASGQRLDMSWYRVEIEHEGKRRGLLVPFQHEPQPGDTRTVLFHPESRYALAFDDQGTSYVVGVK
jgi:hypothetical protein